MTTYELMVIINPAISDDEKNTVIDMMTTTLEKYGKVSGKDVWGEKKMAYKINSSSNGYYILFNLEIDGKEIKNINKGFNLEGDIWRYMFVKQED